VTLHDVYHASAHRGENLPAERLYDVNGTAPEAFRSSVLVDVSRQFDVDPFVVAALRVLKKR
jgi:hypothetical protein